MFSQGSKSPDSPDQPSERSYSPSRASGEASVIGPDLRVVGDLHCEGDIQIKGRVEGDVKSRSVTVDEGAHVEGAIMGDSVHISGSIKGQIQAPSVTVAKTAKVVGDIVHQTLSVEAGAHLDGSCRRLEAKKPIEQPGVSALKTAPAQPPQAEKKAAS
jgi:cytoskeletal protein CcmA (bactofilin family)